MTGKGSAASARTQGADWVSLQGHYAGFASRFVAYVVDFAVSSAVFALALATISFVAQILTGHSIHWSEDHIVVGVAAAVWQFIYFGYSWATTGKTAGMALLGVRVVRADGAIIDPWRGVLRALVFPLSFLLFGLGFLGILVQREHRALQDLIAGTAVIYSWDARAARLRFLVREADAGAGNGRSPQPVAGDIP
jgi:uncharacterized RDD family membrane protein YckC